MSETNTFRTINDHVVPGDVPQNQISIKVLDAPGSGGANHGYLVTGYDVLRNASGVVGTDPQEVSSDLHVLFQNGPIDPELGPNGVTNESLLAIVIDRMRGFQSGDFACRENAIVLTKLEEAMMWLQRRTRDRLRRGVEGKEEA